MDSYRSTMSTSRRRSHRSSRDCPRSGEFLAPQSESLILAPAEARHAAYKMGREELLDLVRSSAPLSDFPLYLQGARSFPVPVYAVWGNHEDKVVIEALLAGAAPENLHLLAPRAPPRVGPFRLFGLGGNLVPDARLHDPPIGGGRGKVWATLSGIGTILEAAESAPWHAVLVHREDRVGLETYSSGR